MSLPGCDTSEFPRVPLPHSLYESKQKTIPMVNTRCMLGRVQLFPVPALWEKQMNWLSSCWEWVTVEVNIVHPSLEAQGPSKQVPAQRTSWLLAAQTSSLGCSSSQPGQERAFSRLTSLPGILLSWVSISPGSCTWKVHNHSSESLMQIYICFLYVKGRASKLVTWTLKMLKQEFTFGLGCLFASYPSAETQSLRG